jgi:hypothetical protein
MKSYPRHSNISRANVESRARWWSLTGMTVPEFNAEAKKRIEAPL